jgi:prepilin-type N-terminal cleavage/methylation domain-containing protein
MKSTNSIYKIKSNLQQGMTLIEVMVSLSIFALVVGGALALFGSTSASQTTTQMKSDLSALRVAVKSLYFGQGGYGTVGLNEVLINSNKVPSTMPVTGTAPNRVINTSQNGTVTVTGATAQYTIAVTNITSDVCVGMVAGTNGWAAVQIGAGAVISTFPISPTTASTNCSASNPIAVTFTAF